MSKSASLLAARILAELENIGITVERAVQGWEKAKTKNDEYYLDGVALNLHGFYSGLERIFERIDRRGCRRFCAVWCQLAP
jgi:hypothetical protein